MKFVQKCGFVLLGAVILFTGYYMGLGVTGNTKLHANSDEEVLRQKTQIIETLVELDAGIENRYLASRKAGELSKLDLSYIEELSKLGVTVLIVPSEDVYTTLNSVKADENQQNGVRTDSVYIPAERKIVVSVSAPNGVLTEQVSRVIR